MPPTQLTVQLTLVVTYDMNGVTVEHIHSLLEHSVRNAIGNGMLTSSTSAEVDTWSMTIDSK
jgi:hypothetical protein